MKPEEKYSKISNLRRDLCVMVHRFCYPNMASLFLSARVPTRARWNTLRTKVPFYFRHVHNWSWLLCCYGKVPFSSETDGYLGSSLLLATASSFYSPAWLMKGMETWKKWKMLSCMKKVNYFSPFMFSLAFFFFRVSCLRFISSSSSVRFSLASLNEHMLDVERFNAALNDGYFKD